MMPKFDERVVETVILLLVREYQTKRIELADDLLALGQVAHFLDIHSYVKKEKAFENDSFLGSAVRLKARDQALMIEVNGEEKAARQELSFMAVPKISNAHYLANTKTPFYAEWVNLYTPPRLSRKIIRFGFWLMACLRISRKDIVFAFDVSDTKLRDILFCHIYTGSKDGKRLVTFMRQCEGGWNYEKCSISSERNQVLEDGVRRLEQMQELFDEKNVPRLITFRKEALYSFKVSSQKFKRSYSLVKDKKKLMAFLNGLYRDTEEINILKKYNELKSCLNDDELIELFDNCLEFTEMSAPSHGDLSPTNMYITQNDELFVFDLELYDSGRPVGYDLFSLLFYDPKTVVKYESLDFVDGALDELLPLLNVPPKSITVNKGLSALVFLIERLHYDSQWSTRYPGGFRLLKAYIMKCLKGE